MAEAVFIKFRPEAVRKLRYGAGLLLFAGIGMCALGFSDAPAEGSAYLAKAFAVPLGLFCFASVPYVLVLASRWSSGRPALLISDGDVKIGVTIHKRLLRFDRNEIEGIETTMFSMRDHDVPYLLIAFRERKTAWRAVGPFGLLTDWKMAIRADILDLSWEEIQAEVERFRPKPLDPELVEEMRVWARDFARRLERERTHDGDLVTFS